MLAWAAMDSPSIQSLPKRPAPLNNFDSDSLSTALKTHFGHREFRAGQLEVISRILKKTSCLAVMPTAAGKSLCYQLPAVVMKQSLTIVISPLLSLMKDQVDSMLKIGIPCARLDSTLTAVEVQKVFEHTRKGNLCLLYVSPERFHNERFLKLLQKVEVSLLVVDEAHCISEWGHNFRPDYLRLAEFAQECSATTLLALTATAPPRVATDILDRFGLPPENLIKLPFDRPNLVLSVKPGIGDEVERMSQLMTVLQFQEPGPTIVYVTFQKTANKLCQVLEEKKFNVKAYHAGKSAGERELIQDWFVHSSVLENPIVVCTIAFGMGIDKKDIRYIYHFNMAKSVEGYAQEVGRAGRDGALAQCVSFLSVDDVPLLRSMVYSNTPSPRALHTFLSCVFHEFRILSHCKDYQESDFSLYDFSQLTDIKETVLRTLLAHLQIKKFLKECTGYFESTQITLQDEARTVQDIRKMTELPLCASSIYSLAIELKKKLRRNAKWITLETRAISNDLGISPMDVHSALQRMQDSELLTIGGKPGKIRSRFEVLEIPPAEKLEELAATLFQTAHDVQTKELERINEIWRLLAAENGNGIRERLVCFFDKVDNVKSSASKEEINSSQENCDFLSEPPEENQDLSLEQIAILQKLVQSGELPTDDPYLVARFALGINSPRIQKRGWNKHQSFGCCSSSSFPAALKFANNIDLAS